MKKFIVSLFVFAVAIVFSTEVSAQKFRSKDVKAGKCSLFTISVPVKG